MEIQIPNITRKITDISIHCSATRANLDFYGSSATADIGVKEITKWHLDRGFNTIGYHYVIRRNGTIEIGRDLNKAGAHVTGHNSNSIGICLVGGVDAKNKAENNYTPEQWKSLKELLDALRIKFPKTIIKGHRDYPNVKKDCPCCNIGEWCKLMYIQQDTR